MRVVIFVSIGATLGPSFVAATTAATATSPTITLATASIASIVVVGGVRVVTLVFLRLGLLKVCPHVLHYFHHGMHEFSHIFVLRSVHNMLLGSGWGLSVDGLFQHGFFKVLLVVDFVAETVNNLRDDRVGRLETTLIN